MTSTSETRSALAGLFLLGILASAVSAQPDGTTGTSSGDFESLQSAFERGEIPLDLDSMCRSDAALPSARAATVKQDLARNLAPLISSAGDPDLRKRRALHLSAQQLYERASSGADDFARLKKDAASSRPEQLLSLLYDLRGRILTTSQLRDARAAIADIQIVKGKVDLKLKSGPINEDAYALMARAIAYELDRPKSEGLDCTGSSLYRFVSDPARQLAPATYASIKHADLLTLYEQVEGRIESLTRRMSAGGSDSASERADIDAVIAALEQTGTAYGKGLKVLGDALELHAKYLSGMAGTPISAALSRPATEAPAKAGSTAPEEAAKASGAVDQTTPAKTEVATAVTIQKPGTPDEVAASTSTAESGPASPADDTGATGAPPASDAAEAPRPVEVAGLVDDESLNADLAAKRALIVAEISRQTESLRSQKTTDGRITTAPVGLANNLYSRMLRVYQIADMLVAPESETNTFRCSMSDDRIRITYSKNTGVLQHLLIEVDERVNRKVLMTWHLELDREDDANYSMRGEFNGIKASLNVEDSNLTEYPNYQQLMVLMNRVNQILDNKI